MLGKKERFDGMLETRNGSFLCDDFKFDFERQKAPLIELWTAEPPIEKEFGVVYLSGMGERHIMLGVEIEQVRQLGKGNGFYVLAYGLERRILAQPVITQTQNMPAPVALAAVAKAAGLGFLSVVPAGIEPKSLVFYDSLRSALDQIALCYGFDQERWTIDVKGEKLILTAGRLPGVSAEVDYEHLIAETEKGLEMAIIPGFRPLLPFTHRGKEFVVDQVTFDGKRQSMFLGLRPWT